MPEDVIDDIIDPQCGIRCASSILEAPMMMWWEKPQGSDGYFREHTNNNIMINDAGNFADLTRQGSLPNNIDGVYTCRFGSSPVNVLHIGVYVSRPGEIKLNLTTAITNLYYLIS